MANFQFEIKYRPGVANKNADVLSRFPQESEVVRSYTATEVSPLDHPSQQDGVDWKGLQRADVALEQVCEWLQQGHHPGKEARDAAPPLAKHLLRDWNRLQLNTGLLQREVQDRLTGDPVAQIVVPTSWSRLGTIPPSNWPYGGCQDRGSLAARILLA